MSEPSRLLPAQRRGATAAEKRALRGLVASIESWGHPAFSGGYAGGCYIVTGWRQGPPGIGRINESLQVRRTTLDGLRDKGLIDASMCPTDEGREAIA